MTGYGVGDAALPPSRRVSGSGAPTGKLTVEIRAVNHRFLDVRVRVPSQVPDLATHVEAIARERLSRGRFDVTVRIEGTVLGAVTLDRERANGVLAELRALRDELAPNEPVPLTLLSAVPEIFTPSIERESETLKNAARSAFHRAIDVLDAMRLREGCALGDDLVRRLGTIRSLTVTIGERAPLVIENYRKRLRDRAERLRLASDVEIDASRLEQELALLADRIDITEELTRLESHASHFEGLLAHPDSLGRRLDFLLQEMAREANTVGAKSQDASIAHAVVELKTEIERMREQVQNVE